MVVTIFHSPMAFSSTGAGGTGTHLQSIKVFSQFPFTFPVFSKTKTIKSSKMRLFSCHFHLFAGKTYRFRISNVGISTSINFRIQGHKMKLVEVEGSHTLQNTYSSLDIHLGQSLSVLVIADQPPKDYYVVISSRFTSPVLTTTAILHYRNSYTRVSGPPPGGPTIDIGSSLSQARSIR